MPRSQELPFGHSSFRRLSAMETLSGKARTPSQRKVLRARQTFGTFGSRPAQFRKRQHEIATSATTFPEEGDHAGSCEQTSRHEIGRTLSMSSMYSYCVNRRKKLSGFHCGRAAALA